MDADYYQPDHLAESIVVSSDPQAARYSRALLIDTMSGNLDLPNHFPPIIGAAFVNKEVVGAVVADIDFNLEPLSAYFNNCTTPIMRLMALRSSEGLRRLGIGRQIIEACAELAVVFDCNEIQAVGASQNDKSFLEAVGFEQSSATTNPNTFMRRIPDNYRPKLSSETTVNIVGS